jgi:hypothetical protein
MGLNLSNHHMAHALDLQKDDAQQRTRQLRQGIVLKKPSPPCTEEVECAEVSMVAGHKGKPDAVVQKGGVAGADASRGNAAAVLAPRRSRRSSR